MIWNIGLKETHPGAASLLAWLLIATMRAIPISYRGAIGVPEPNPEPQSAQERRVAREFNLLPSQLRER